MDAILKNNFQNNLAGYKKVADYTVSGSAITNYDFSSLNITKEDDYIVVSTFIGIGSGTGYLQVNSNYTNTNYWTQELYAGGTTVLGSRSNQPYFVPVQTGNNTQIFTRLKLTNNGNIVFQNTGIFMFGTSTPNIQQLNGSSTFTATSITSLRIASSVANGIGIGSRFQLYKRVAPIVADIIVSVATTSIDLTGLNITKDSEYMLVSDISQTVSNTDAYLMINGNNTLTNYHSQQLSASQSSIGASRVNTPRYMLTIANYKVFGYINIKLTNNGFFEAQTNETAFYGFSAQLENYNLSSTFTASSITSLRIQSGVANGIGIGSRFQLIKLK